MMVFNRRYRPNSPCLHEQTFYVMQNHPKASDLNPGTKNLPFRTINKAASVAKMGNIIFIGEGTYREQIELKNHGHAYIPCSVVTFQAVEGEQVFIKGSDIFEPILTPMSKNMYKAKLPSFLFEDNHYNPYNLSCYADKQYDVRPFSGDRLPKTLGQIFIDGNAYEQVESLDLLASQAGTFLVDKEGKEIFVHFTFEDTPADHLIELIVRQRCFNPAFNQSGVHSDMVCIKTEGIVVEHAAEPGPFCYCRPITYRRNEKSNITVKKSYCYDSSILMVNNISQPAYKSLKNEKLIASMPYCDFNSISKTKDSENIYIIESDDSGRTWSVVDHKKTSSPQSVYDYYFLNNCNCLLRCYLKYKSVSDSLDGSFGQRQWQVMIDYSIDNGHTWNKGQVVDNGSLPHYILELQDGSILMSFEAYREDTGRAFFKCFHGRWDDSVKMISWDNVSELDVDPNMSAPPLRGLEEAKLCQAQDGTIIALMRQCNKLAGYEDPGFPSVKLFSISKDNGYTWTPAKPLCYEEGDYVYSTCSIPGLFCSSKNENVYAIMNISDKPENGCDPRNALYIAQLNSKDYSVIRNTVSIIDTKHREHSNLIRFSNFRYIEDKNTKDLILFMQLSVSEYSHIRFGYDYNLYRYEINLPS